MKEIVCANGRVAIVDDCDFDAISSRRWSGGKYPVSDVYENGKRRTVGMHLLILNPPPGKLVDHINGDSYDNRRENLRVASVAENRWNSKPRRDSRSGFKGVTLAYDPTKARGLRRQRVSGIRWRAAIYLGRKAISLGCYATREDAAKAYDAAALKYFGEFARLNFPEPTKQAA